MPSHSFEVTDATFASEVVEASRRVPVVVDFWAPWCAPCRALKPILEKLADEHGGRFLLAKLNTDENPETAARFAIRSIPAVKGFRDGAVAAEFLGAVPESAVRAFLQQLLPTAAQKLLASARLALEAGDDTTAENRLREALAADPGLDAARLDLAELLVARDAWQDADELLSGLRAPESDERAAQLASRIALWKAAGSLPPAAELLARLQKSPRDLGLRLQLAERHAADGDFQAALDQLLEVVGADRGALRETARTTMLRIFSLAGGDTELVARYRRALASALN